MGTKQKLLTEAELELMAILWKRGEGAVADVISDLPAEEKPAYTTVSTILRILEQKKFLTTRKEGRGHVYIPAVSREVYEARSVDHMVENVFAGAPVSLARQLLKTQEMSAADLAEIRALLDKLESK